LATAAAVSATLAVWREALVVWTEAAGDSADPPVTAETKPSNSRRANASKAHAIGGSAGAAGLLLPAIGPSTMPMAFVIRLVTIFSGFGGAAGSGWTEVDRAVAEAGCAVGCTPAEDNAKVATAFSADAAGGWLAAGGADSFFATAGCGSGAAATACAGPFFGLWAALSASMALEVLFFFVVFFVTGSGAVGLVGAAVSVGFVLFDFPVLVWAFTTPDGTGPEVVCDDVCEAPWDLVGPVASDGSVDDGVDVVTDGGELGLAAAAGVESVSDAEAAPGVASEVDDVLDVVSVPSADARP
jgi:hypothetical protein